MCSSVYLALSYQCDSSSYAVLGYSYAVSRTVATADDDEDDDDVDDDDEDEDGWVCECDS